MSRNYVDNITIATIINYYCVQNVQDEFVEMRKDSKAAFTPEMFHQRLVMARCATSYSTAILLDNKSRLYKNLKRLFFSALQELKMKFSVIL